MQRIVHPLRRFLLSRTVVTCAMVMTTIVAGAIAHADAQTIYGVTSASQLVTFDAATPNTLTASVALTGLQPAETIVGIDMRPATGQLVGVGSTGRVYLINPGTGQASSTNTSPPAITLDGTAFGLDFNPVVDRLRLVSDNEQNLRINPNNGALAGTDTPLTPPGAVAACAYTNNFAGATITTLYGIDAASDQLVLQGGLNGSVAGGPNGGVITTVGPLGVDTTTQIGFDITTVGATQTAWASLTVAGASSLYRINLTTGAATLVGPIGAGLTITGLAVTSPTGVTLYGVAGASTLVSFNSAVPGTILASVGISGLSVGETVLGLDARPATGQLYALGSFGQIYTIDPTSGQALAVGGPLPLTLNGSDFGIDFNPVVDRLRVVSNAGQNLRLHPVTGAVAGVDTPLAPAGGIGGAAYTNNVAGATQTTLYDIDTDADTLVRQGGVNGMPSPNLGQLTVVGPLGVDAAAVLGFDITAIDGTAYAAMTVGGTATLYRINLATGAATAVGPIGGGGPIRGLTAAFPGQIELSSDTFFGVEGNSATVTLRRTGGAATPLSVTLATSGGTATAGADYTAVSRIVTLLSGETSATVTIPLLEDPTDEPDETFVVSLSSPSVGTRLGDRALATVVILDNDNPDIAPTISIVSPTTDPGFAATSPFITLAGTAADASGIASVSWVSDRGVSGAASGTTDWSAAGIPLFPGANTITVRATDTTGSSGIDVITVSLDSLLYTLAEGATGDFFDLDVLLANPHPTPVPVTLDFLREDGSTITQLRSLPALSRTTIRVDDIAGLETGAVSTIVTSTSARPIVVERTMRWDRTGYGAHGEKATGGPALTWYFAEGAQGFFDTFLLLTNAGGGANNAHVSFLLEDDETIEADFPMLGTSRLSVPLNTIPALSGRAFGIIVTFTAPGVAERAMYFGTPLYNGGHDSVGETALATDWFLAEGATGDFFTTFLLLANPGATDAALTLTYLPESGVPVVKPVTLEAGRRMTINVAGENASLAQTTVATRVQSTAPIVVERAQYWPGPASQWYEAHNSFGVTALGTKWGLAEGRIGGTGEAQTFILLANPGTTEATVTVQFLREPGRSPRVVTRVVTVPAMSRRTLGPAEQGPDLAEETFGAIVSSTEPIAVERAVYWNANGQFWAAGTNASATRLP